MPKLKRLTGGNDLHYSATKNLFYVVIPEELIATAKSLGLPDDSKFEVYREKWLAAYEKGPFEGMLYSDPAEEQFEKWKAQAKESKPVIIFNIQLQNGTKNIDGNDALGLALGLSCAVYDESWFGEGKHDFEFRRWIGPKPYYGETRFNTPSEGDHISYRERTVTLEWSEAVESSVVQLMNQFESLTSRFLALFESDELGALLMGQRLLAMPQDDGAQ